MGADADTTWSSLIASRHHSAMGGGNRATEGRSLCLGSPMGIHFVTGMLTTYILLQLAEPMHAITPTRYYLTCILFGILSGYGLAELAIKTMGNIPP